MKGIIISKIVPLIKSLVNEVSDASTVALVGMLCVAGVLMLLGNEHGAKKVTKNALYGYILIQIAGLLL